MSNEQSIGLKTLKDVALLLPSVYSEASAKTLAAALHKAERLTGLRLSQIPANENDWIRRAQSIIWAGEFRGATPGDQEAAFNIWVKKIASTIRRAQESVTAPVKVSDQRGAWDQIVDYAARVENTFDDAGNRILPNMFSVSMTILRSHGGHLHPSEVTTETARQSLIACRADKAASFRNAIAAFNRLVREKNRHPAIAHLLPQLPIGPIPHLRDASLDWTRFTPAFVASRDRAITRAIAADRTRRGDRFKGKLGKGRLSAAGQRKGRRRGVGNPDSARKNHLNALSWLVRHAYPDRSVSYHLNDIRDLFTTEIVKRAVDTYIARAEASEVLLNPTETSSAGGVLARLQVLADRNEWPEDVVFELEDARFDRVDSHQSREMSKEREQFVKLVQRDPAVPRAIVSGPRRLAEEAQLVFDDWKSFKTREREAALHLSMGASLLALLLARSVRSRNVHELIICGDNAELLRPLRDARPWLEIDRRRVKNASPIAGEIPERQWRVIMQWLDQGLPKWCEKHGIDFDANVLLLPGPKGLLSRHTYNRVWNKCVARIGVPGLQPHLMRHVMATIWLAANPGDYATVAAFLCDKVSTVEKFYARGEGAAAAKLFAEALEALDPTLETFLNRRTA
ncbi:hypothetical protein B6V73_19340 [Thioclava sp. JM3]|uniref:hypothetical protein n=1 Tax=Thioclava sp. JM3 TaxID=1973004 RepID=UPI000B53F502|nr:hypothetical protein [Thioclava sp. JM3]OWY10439.1 hypothetical protein B6V73_19340 [Thioclava sp. JM3]